MKAEEWPILFSLIIMPLFTASYRLIKDSLFLRKQS
jgi:hypothetical protein